MGQCKIHVAIIGAGLGGLAAAIGIARAGHKVTVMEQSPSLGEIGAGIQIPPNSSRILREWGILPDIEAVSVTPRNWLLRSYKDGKILAKHSIDPTIRNRYDAPYLHIHRADYHKVLVREAERLGVQIHLDSLVERIDFEKPRMYIKDKPSFDADLLVGADGLKSICREALLGRSDPPYLTGDLGYRVTVPTSELCKDPMLRTLIETPNINIWMGPDAHVIVYLLKSGGLLNIALLRPDNLPELINKAKADLKEMNELFQSWDPQLRALLRHCKDTSKWRLQNSREMDSWRHPSGKFVLLGDACHATLPYLAQGAALAIEDGAALGTLFEKVQGMHQLHDLLMIYETIRKRRTTLVVQGSSEIGRNVFHLRDGPLQQERDRLLAEFSDEPYEGYPNMWVDPVYQRFLFAYDAFTEAANAWEKYEKGAFQNGDGC